MRWNLTKMAKKIKFFLIFPLLLICFMGSLFSQNDTIPIARPPLIGDNWETLKSEEKSLLNKAKILTKNIKTQKDSCLELMINYLVNEKELTNYTSLEFAKIIYKIPSDDALVFLLHNIAVPVGTIFESGVYNRLKVYPFYHIFRIDSIPSRVNEVIPLVLESPLLDDCELPGMQLRLISLILFSNTSISYEDLIRKYLINSEIGRIELSTCKKKNLKMLLNKSYTNLNESRNIKRYDFDMKVLEKN